MAPLPRRSWAPSCDSSAWIRVRRSCRRWWTRWTRMATGRLVSHHLAEWINLYVLKNFTILKFRTKIWMWQNALRRTFNVSPFKVQETHKFSTTVLSLKLIIEIKVNPSSSCLVNNFNFFRLLFKIPKNVQLDKLLTGLHLCLYCVRSMFWIRLNLFFDSAQSMFWLCVTGFELLVCEFHSVKFKFSKLNHPKFLLMFSTKRVKSFGLNVSELNHYEAKMCTE